MTQQARSRRSTAFAWLGLMGLWLLLRAPISSAPGAPPPPPPLPSPSPGAASWTWVTSVGSHAVSVVDTGSGRLVRVLPVEDAEEPAGISISSDGRTVWLLDNVTRLRVLEGATGVVREEYRVPRSRVRTPGPTCRLSPDGRWLFIRSGDARGLRVFDRVQRRVHVVPAPACVDSRIAIPSRGSAIYVACQRDVHVLAPTPRGFKIVATRRLPVMRTADVAAHPGGAYVLEEPTRRGAWRLIQVDRTGTSQVLDLHRRLPIEWRSEEGSAWLAVAPSGDWLAVGRGHRVAFLRGPDLRLEDAIYLEAPVLAAAFDPAGRNLLALSGGQLVRIFTGDRRLFPLADRLLETDAGLQVVVGPVPVEVRPR